MNDTTSLAEIARGDLDGLGAASSDLVSQATTRHEPSTTA